MQTPCNAMMMMLLLMITAMMMMLMILCSTAGLNRFDQCRCYLSVEYGAVTISSNIEADIALLRIDQCKQGLPPPARRSRGTKVLHATQPTIEAQVLHSHVLHTQLQKAKTVAPTEYLAQKIPPAKVNSHYALQPTIGSQVLHNQVLHTTKSSISFR